MSDKPFRPMLASPVDLAKLAFPVLVSPKLDGIRCLAMNGRAMSRSMKPIPSAHVQAFFAQHADLLDGLDGELIVGDPTASDVFRTTTSAVMADDKVFDFTYAVFDRWDSPVRFAQRLIEVAGRVERLALETGSSVRLVTMVPHVVVYNQAELDAQEADALAVGYEGLMLRSVDGPYKQGRSTAREGWLLKLKRHEQDEAEIIGFEEEMENTNEAVKNELGRTKRSSAKEGMVGKARLGNFLARMVNGRFAGVEFSVGSGIDHAERERVWANRDAMLGRIITVEHFPIGAKDAPRFPRFKGYRDTRDMGGE